MDQLLPRNRALRALTMLAGAAWLLLGFYLAFLHENAPTALSPVAEAAERTSRVEGYRFDMTAQMTAPATGGIDVRGSGAYNGSTDRFSMWLKATGSFPGIGSSFEMLEVGEGTTFYMNSPILSPALPDGKSWMKMDLSDVLGEGVNADPRQQLDQLEDVADVRVVGTEKVRGVPTTRYRAMVDVGEAGLPGYAPGAVIPSDVWIDSEGYVRRNTVSAPAGTVGGGGFTMRMDVYGIGSNPDIAIPPDAAVFDGSELLDQLEGLQSLSR